jgi:hypothetical protein
VSSADILSLPAGYSGVGLLTKVDPIEVKYGIGLAEHDNEGRVITAEYDRFFLVVSYIPNSGRKLVRLAYRQEFNRVFHTYLKELEKKKPVIWCGDLNVAHQPIDLTNPKTNAKTAGFTKEERADFSRILDDGFLDSCKISARTSSVVHCKPSSFRSVSLSGATRCLHLLGVLSQCSCTQHRLAFGLLSSLVESGRVHLRCSHSEWCLWIRSLSNSSSSCHVNYLSLSLSLSFFVSIYSS